jgi:hypothetical protein
MMTAHQLVEALSQTKDSFEVVTVSLMSMDTDGMDKAIIEADMRMENILMALKMDTSGDLKKEVVSLLAGSIMETVLRLESMDTVPLWEDLEAAIKAVDENVPSEVLDLLKKFLASRALIHEIAQKLY